jgi:hypothetical protein
MHFNNLIATLESVHADFASRTVQQVNTALTVRNWLIGYYLVEYEQNGEDRATYGERFMERTSARLKSTKGMTISNLKNFRQFYLNYKWFGETIRSYLGELKIRQTLSGELKANTNEDELRLPVAKLLNTLTFSH